jgi:DNA adenine methylase
MNPEPTPAKPAIRWPGGKTSLLPHILPLIPPHHCYCEPFSGGLAMLCAKPRSPIEVINDLNGDLINFYRIVRYHLNPLLDELEFVPGSRQEFYDFIRQPGLTDIQRAARWWYRNKNGFASDSNSFGRSAKSGGASLSSRSAALDKIRALNARLDKVCIENLDWQRCVEINDTPESFFFVDPPYTGCKQKAYQSWTLDDVKGLGEVLRGLQGRWLLTVNDTPEICSLFEDCRVKPVTRARGLNAKAAKPYAELIICPGKNGGGGR